jgi:plastocyanin domain-containing protein
VTPCFVENTPMRRLLIAIFLFAAPPALAGDSAPAPAPDKAARKIEIKVTEDGFEPREVKLKKGESVTLVFKRETENTCITAVDIPKEKVAGFELPLNKAVSLTITPKEAGVEKFHCSAMGMGDGKLIVGE